MHCVLLSVGEEVRTEKLFFTGERTMPEKETWYIRMAHGGIPDEDPQEGWRAVQAEQVVLPFFEEFDFFVHREILDVVDDGVYGDWKVSEGRSGCGITPESARSKPRAVLCIMRILVEGGWTKRKFREHITNKVKMSGLSPKYRKEKAKDTETVEDEYAFERTVDDC